MDPKRVVVEMGAHPQWTGTINTNTQMQYLAPRLTFASAGQPNLSFDPWFTTKVASQFYNRTPWVIT